MKTLILTERQIRNVIDGVISEQTVVRNEVRKPASLPPINIPYKFPSGYWLPTKDLVSQVTNSLNPVIEFIRQHQSQKIEVSIQAGESQVTNADNEPTSKNKGKTVPQKYLANNRANSVKSILNNYFDNLIKSKAITVKPTFIENQIVIGSTPYERGVSKPNDPKYSEEQFINVIVNATGESVTIEETCLVGLRLMIDYNSNWCTDTDKSRCHQCNEAVFSIYANGIPIKNDKGSNYANLNNGGDGKSRQWIGRFSEADSKAVLQGGKKEIIITYQCESDNGSGCHSDAMHVTIFDNTNKEIFNDFVSGGYRIKKSDGQRLLLKTNECGKVTEVAPRASAPESKPKPKRTIQKWDMDANDVVKSGAKVYLTVDEQGKVHPEKLFDPIYDKSNLAFWAKNIKTWSDFLYQYSDYIKPRHIKSIQAAAEQLKNSTPPTTTTVPST
jgi:hypothetical protein